MRTVLFVAGAAVVGAAVGALIGNAFERYFGRPWI